MYSQRIWYNRFLKIDKSTYFVKTFHQAGVNCIKDLFSENGSLLKWNDFRQLYNLPQTDCFKWIQIANSIPKKWKQVILDDRGVSKNPDLSHQHLLDLTRQLTMDKLSSRQIYALLVRKTFARPTSEKTIQKHLNTEQIDWKNVYSMGYETTIDTYGRMFCFKLNHNILFLNKQLYLCGLSDTTLCSLCNLENESIIHLFAECRKTVQVWNDLKVHFRNKVQLLSRT